MVGNGNFLSCFQAPKQTARDLQIPCPDTMEEQKSKIPWGKRILMQAQARKKMKQNNKTLNVRHKRKRYTRKQLSYRATYYIKKLNC